MKLSNLKLFLGLIFAFSLWSCIEQKDQTSTGEERIIIQNSSGAPSLSPSLKSWTGLAGVCSNASLSDAEAVVCKLDELLDEVAKSGKPLSDFQNDFDSWVVSAQDVMSVVCQQKDDITFLVVGTANVLASRGLISLPIAMNSVKGAAGVHPIVQKIIFEVVLLAVKKSCAVDPNKILSVISSNPAAGGGSNTGGGGSTSPGAGGPVSPNPISPSPINPNPINPGPGAGGGNNPISPAPNPPGSGNPGSLVCSSLQLKYQYYCQPHCVANNTCDANSCNLAAQACKANNCTCN